MNNYLPMFVPGAGNAKATRPDELVGLSSHKLDESQMTASLFKFVASKKTAPVPTGNVGECKDMRVRILQMSLFPDIYDKHKKVHHPGNVDFGNYD